jgi:putative DNA primase/helicase
VSQEILTAALHFANAKICVVPVANDGSKRPALSNWKQYQNQMPTPSELMEWFSKPGVEGLGIITGEISGIEMLELEGRAVADGMLEQANP